MSVNPKQPRFDFFEQGASFHEMNSKTILVTGGAGYIGSHTTVELLQAGFDVVVVDNLENSNAAVIDRVEKITGRRPKFVEADIRDTETIVRLLREHQVGAVMHFAGLKSVNESCAVPLRYFDTNVAGSVRLLQAMAEAGVRRMVFSSSTTVYGNAKAPITEKVPLVPVSPYGRSKLMVEEMLRDLAAVKVQDWRFVILRYFNPVGAHASGLIGENPNGIPTNLMPYVCQVAVGRLKKLSIFGNDYDTKDGTAIRDFIHVVDLAKGHLAALNALENPGSQVVVTVNLGTGRGSSVLELVTTFAEVNRVRVPYEFAPRREGDVVVSYADAKLAYDALEWRTERTLVEMCRDAWNWQSKNPNGYEKPTA
jgi:UDP-glucose 4-epimerase